MDVHLPAGINIFCHLRRIFNHRRHKRSHKFYWIIKFQIGSLVGDNRIRSGMGFIECILCKINHFIINLVRRLFIDPIVYTARYPSLFIPIYENLAFLSHNIAFFL